MTDASIVRSGENSPEQVAYRLFTHIMAVEKRSLTPDPTTSNYPLADRKLILDTYRECLAAVKYPTKSGGQHRS